MRTRICAWVIAVYLLAMSMAGGDDEGDDGD